MAPRLRIEATTAPDGRPVVYLYVNGRRFVMDAPSPEIARRLALDVARDLGVAVEVSHG